MRKELWSWVDAEESARSFVLGVTSENPDFKGHEVFFTIAPTTCQEELTPDLVAEHWPNAELRRQFTGRESLYDCSKAERLLGWVHHDHNGLEPDVPPPAADEPVKAVAAEVAPAAVAVVEPEAAPSPAPALDSHAVAATTESVTCLLRLVDQRLTSSHSPLAQRQTRQSSSSGSTAPSPSSTLAQSKSSQKLTLSKKLLLLLPFKRRPQTQVLSK